VSTSCSSLPFANAPGDGLDIMNIYAAAWLALPNTNSYRYYFTPYLLYSIALRGLTSRILFLIFACSCSYNREFHSLRPRIKESSVVYAPSPTASRTKPHDRLLAPPHSPFDIFHLLRISAILLVVCNVVRAFCSVLRRVASSYNLLCCKLL
jgi:hypothetical protein